MQTLFKLRERLKILGIDGMLITNLVNCRYLTGFTGSYCVVLISATESKILTDPHYFDQAREETDHYEIVLHTKFLIQEKIKEVVTHAEMMGISRLGFESDHLSYSSFNLYRHHLKSELIPTSRIIENLRMIKKTKEIIAIHTAANVANSTFSHLLEFIRPGKTEVNVCHEINSYIKQKTGSENVFFSNVTSGYRTAIVCGKTSNKIITKGEVVTIKLIISLNGYWSKLVRTISVGKPNDNYKELYEAVFVALHKGIYKMTPSHSIRELNLTLKDAMIENGYADYYRIQGAGQGLEKEEAPFFEQESNDKLQDGMVLSVEPGIFIPHIGGVCIGEMFEITKSGPIKITDTSSELIVI